MTVQTNAKNTEFQAYLEIERINSVRNRHPLRFLAATNFVAKEAIEEYPDVQEPEDFQRLDFSHLQVMSIGTVPLFEQIDQCVSQLEAHWNDLAHDAYVEGQIFDHYEQQEKREEQFWTELLHTLKNIFS